MGKIENKIKKENIMSSPEKKAFSQWLIEGLEKGYIQELDKQLRLQYHIKEQCTSKQWEEAMKYFSGN